MLSKRTKLTKFVAIFTATIFLISCANMDKEQIGTLAGAVVGGIVGKKLGGKQGAALGIGIGGLIGNRIGAHLDEQDRKKLAELEQKALQTGESGSFVTNKTKAKVTVTAAQPTFENKKPFVLSQELSVYPIVMVDPLETAAYVDTPLFSSLDENLRPRMVVGKNFIFTVAANVVNESWAVVGDSNVGIGYVPMRYLKESIVTDSTRYGVPAQVAKQVATPASKAAPGKTNVAKATIAKKETVPPTPKAQSLTSKEEYDRELSRLKAAYPDTSTQQPQPQTQIAQAPSVIKPLAVAATPVMAPRIVQASAECKVLVRKVEPEASQGGPLTESIKYCKEPPKGWQTQTA